MSALGMKKRVYISYGESKNINGLELFERDLQEYIKKNELL